MDCIYLGNMLYISSEYALYIRNNIIWGSNVLFYYVMCGMETFIIANINQGDSARRVICNWRALLCLIRLIWK